MNDGFLNLYGKYWRRGKKLRLEFSFLMNKCTCPRAYFDLSTDFTGINRDYPRENQRKGSVHLFRRKSSVEADEQISPGNFLGIFPAEEYRSTHYLGNISWDSD